MLVIKRCTIAVAVTICGLLSGCQTVAPKADPIPASASMSQAEMENLGAQAEQAIARGDYPNAIALYQRVLEAYPRSAPAWFRLGTVHLRVNDQRMAQYDFERSLQADPNLTKAHANLALTHLKQFRLSAARAIASDQVSEDNRATLRSLMRDVDHALYPPASLPPTVLQ
jgi:tetratricopeptide (TPR) repeat protein